MDTTAIILIAFFVFCVFMIIYKLSHKEDDKQGNKISQKEIEQAEAQFSPEQLKFLKTAGFLFNHNMIMPLCQIYEKCGMPHDIAYSKDRNKIK